jgi:hypothetical protein
MAEGGAKGVSVLFDCCMAEESIHFRRISGARGIYLLFLNGLNHAQ